MQKNGSVYFKVFTSLAAAAKKKCLKAEKNTLSNFEDTKRDRKDAIRAKTIITFNCNFTKEICNFTK